MLVAASLADLRGPVSGMVELPLYLYWSGTHGWFSLDDPVQRRLVCTIVLREARCPDDLAAFVDGGMLTALWPRMVLPRPVRKAWGDQHPVLRPSAAPAGLPWLWTPAGCELAAGPGCQARPGDARVMAGLGAAPGGQHRGHGPRGDGVSAGRASAGDQDRTAPSHAVNACRPRPSPCGGELMIPAGGGPGRAARRRVAPPDLRRDAQAECHSGDRPPSRTRTR